MTDITREEAIRRLKHLKRFEGADFTCAINFGVSDMERVEELEKENITLKESLTNILKTNEGYRSELKHFKNMSKDLEAENKRLKDGIEKVKAEIHTLDDLNPDYPMDRTIHVSKWAVIEIINKYLGE